MSSSPLVNGLNQFLDIPAMNQRFEALKGEQYEVRTHWKRTHLAMACALSVLSACLYKKALIRPSAAVGLVALGALVTSFERERVMKKSYQDLYDIYDMCLKTMKFLRESKANELCQRINQPDSSWNK